MLVLREKLSDGLVREWEIKRVYAHEKTQYQDVLIAETSHGRTLFCDYERQSASLTQLLYHEAQVYPALMYLEQARHALVIGSSEGVVPKLLHDVGFEHVVHVDLDERCMELCAQHLDYGYHYIQQFPYREIIFADGIDYLKRCTRQFDLIVLDLPDISYHTRETWEKMLALAPDRLTPSGVLITQAGCPTYWRNEGLKAVYNLVEAADKRLFVAVEQEWSWLLLSNKLFPKACTEAFDRMWEESPAVHFTQADLLAGIYVPKSLR